MANASTAVAWVLVRDDGQVAEWERESVLLFRSEREAAKFNNQVVGRTDLRGRYTPRPLVGRLLARVEGRTLAARIDHGGRKVAYVLLDNARPAEAFDVADAVLTAVAG
jgi:hypothetical protein